MNKVKVVSAYVPLKVKHLSPEQYLEYGKRLETACEGRLTILEGELWGCWLFGWLNDHGLLGLRPATETPIDRYETWQDHVNSNIIQHSRLEWARKLYGKYGPVDGNEVVVWLDLAILKQGAWNGKQLTEEHVAKFLRAVEQYDFSDGSMPFPGISAEYPFPVTPFSNNWRFCGSTHIWLAGFLPKLEACYRFWTKQFIRTYRRVPIDLAIWPTVEETSGLPFRWYQAEYDHTQLTGFPGYGG